MASPKSNISSLKILHHCRVSPAPQSATTTSSLRLTFFDQMWLRFHPVERLFFYSLPQLHTSLFLDSIVPKLKHSLSLTLQHFLPLAGRIIWPSDSSTPIIQYTPGDAVSLVIAQSDSDFNLHSSNSPREAALSRSFVPHLDSSVSSASLLSLQITLFPNTGFCIGLTTHHCALDGKSSTMFMKAWAHICQTQENGESWSLLPELEPFFDRKAIITHQDSTGLENLYTNQWLQFDPSLSENNRPSLKIVHDTFKPIVEQSTRATFELTREDLEKLKKRVLEKWEEENQNADEESKSTPPPPPPSPPPPPRRLSTFVVTIAYVSVCAAKAIERTKKKRQKFVFSFPVDCRARLEPPVPENYFGNCVMLHIGEGFSEEDGVVVVAQKVQSKIREIMEEKGVLDGAETLLYTFPSLKSKGIEIVGVAGSSQFGVYGTDFGWGRPKKVEITSVDRGLTFAMAESKDGNGGVEVGVVLNQQVMDCFTTIFGEEIESL